MAKQYPGGKIVKTNSVAQPLILGGANKTGTPIELQKQYF